MHKSLDQGIDGINAHHSAWMLSLIGVLKVTNNWPPVQKNTDDLDDVRECLSRLAFAFTGLLGNRLDPEVTRARLRELAGIAREIGELCDRRGSA